MAGRPCREPPLHTSNTVVLLLLLSLLALAPVPPVSGWVSFPVLTVVFRCLPRLGAYSCAAAPT
jgi:hypothetical protein